MQKLLSLTQRVFCILKIKINNLSATDTDVS